MEDVDNEIELVIKQLPFNTQIGLDGFFPSQIVGSDTCLVDDFDIRDSPGRSCTLIHFSKIREPDIGNPVVTYRTVRSPDFKIVEPWECFLYKLVACRYPA